MIDFLRELWHQIKYNNRHASGCKPKRMKWGTKGKR